MLLSGQLAVVTGGGRVMRRHCSAAILQGQPQTADEVASEALLLIFRPGQRDYWAGSDRGRRNGFLLSSSANAKPRRA